jgi:hypothetical protein
MTLRVPRPVLVLASALAVVGLAACGTSTSAAKAPASSTAATDAPTTASATGATNPGGGGPNGSGPLTSEQRAALQAYRDCLTQNGVNIPQRGQRGSSTSAGETTTVVTTPRTTVDPAVLKAAQDACKDKLPAGVDPNSAFGGGGGGFGGGPGRPGGAGGAAFQAYLSCLKDNGVKVPDTSSTSAGTPASGPPASIDRNDPNFAAANAKCQVLLPNRQNGGSTTTATTANG